MTRRPLVKAAALFVLTAALVGVAGADYPHSGRPKQYVSGSKAMFAVWEDNGDWHVRTTSKIGPGGKPGERVTFTGRVEVVGDRLAGEINALERAKKAKDADFVLVHTNGRGFDFKFATFGFTDGVKFRVGKKATEIKFKLLVNEDDDPRKIFIGQKGTHPEKAEFSLPASTSK